MDADRTCKESKFELSRMFMSEVKRVETEIMIKK